jgi:hypothetical protein
VPLAASPSADQPAALAVTRPTPKGYLVGTHRACAPNQTLRRIEPVLGRIGITRPASAANVSGRNRAAVAFSYRTSQARSWQ